MKQIKNFFFEGESLSLKERFLTIRNFRTDFISFWFRLSYIHDYKARLLINLTICTACSKTYSFLESRVLFASSIVGIKNCLGINATSSLLQSLIKLLKSSEKLQTNNNFDVLMNITNVSVKGRATFSTFKAIKVHLRISWWFKKTNS